ncbi:hypothetical protein GJ744_011177 [Endocarpon pusillum]|uniref:Apoptosis-inducing TAF9-like domain 1 family protein n=1 Tax=Endocarpon pusillum TaxID=364733 RepID=A0A8H7E4X2_9EURO|nr:hypothetical protein GJ744_011177 [Endocarpon pusillum]
MAEPSRGRRDLDADARKLEERLKSTLWLHIGRAVDTECLHLDTSATPQFIGSLTELVWTQVENTAADLESFAKHAKRNVVRVDDVLLLARRNEGLEAILRDFVARLEAKKRGRRRGEEEEDGEDGEEEVVGVGDGKGKGRKKG